MTKNASAYCVFRKKKFSMMILPNYLQDCKNRHTFVKQKHRYSGAKRREVTHS